MARRSRYTEGVDWLGFDPATPAATRRRVAVVLCLALLGISSSAVLVRGMAAPALAIAAWRTLGAAALLAPTGARGLAALTWRDALATAVAGGALGLHFWSWFAAVQHTTVLRSTVLVCLVPVWTAGIEWVVSRRRPPRAHWLGLAVALPGLGLLAGDEGQSAISGDLLAVGAGIVWAIYLAIGRSVRQRVPVATYMGAVCLAAAALLFPVAWIGQTPLLGFPPATWALIGAAIVGPQLLGHQGFAYAVRWLPATTISTLLLLEPVGATLLAMGILGEIPGPAAAVGGVSVLLGIGIATRR